MKIIKLNCDLCNKELEENNMRKGNILQGGQLISKNSLEFTYEGFKKKGDLCFSCARKLRDFIEDMKERR